MRINFGFGGMMGDTIEATLEIYLGNQLIQSQQLQAPEMILKMQLMNLVQDLANDTRPMKMKVIKLVPCWNQYEQKMTTIDEWLEYQNNAMCGDM